MERYNSFRIIHKALRALLYETALTLQVTNFEDADQAEEALKKVSGTLFLFERHAYHEDTSILPAIEMYEPVLVESFECEHEKDHALAAQLQHLLNMFGEAAAVGAEEIVGSAISKAFVEFMVFNLEHMSREEILVNQALWKHYTDEQLILLNQVMVSNIPPAEKALNAQWIMRGVNDKEAADWLKGVRPHMPGFMFESLLNTAEAEMGETRFNRVMNSLMDTSMVYNEYL